MHYEKMECLIIHTRPFKETSLILDVFTRLHGKLSLIAKGAKRPKSRVRGIVQPFIPLLVSAVGKGELLTVTLLEQMSLGYAYQGKGLLSALYLNELLARLLPKLDPYPDFFDFYKGTLQTLQDSENKEKTQWVLRQFEYQLVKALGYGFDLEMDALRHPIRAEQLYSFEGQRGLVAVERAKFGIYGKSLIAIREGQPSMQALVEFRILMRQVLYNQMGGSTVHARELVRTVGDVIDEELR